MRQYEIRIRYESVTSSRTDKNQGRCQLGKWESKRRLQRLPLGKGCFVLVNCAPWWARSWHVCDSLPQRTNAPWRESGSFRYTERSFRKKLTFRAPKPNCRVSSAPRLILSTALPQGTKGLSSHTVGLVTRVLIIRVVLKFWLLIWEMWKTLVLYFIILSFKNNSGHWHRKDDPQLGRIFCCKIICFSYFLSAYLLSLKWSCGLRLIYV